MIGMSQPGRRIGRGWLVAWAAAALIGAASCVFEEKVCTAKGCIDGLTIALDANFEQGATYQIEVNADSASILSCSFTPTSGPMAPMQCTSSSKTHNEFGNRVQIRDNTLNRVQVVVSKGGVKVSDEAFEPKYATEEINGPGCGTCTHSAISVNLPGN